MEPTLSKLTKLPKEVSLRMFKRFIAILRLPFSLGKSLVVLVVDFKE